MDQMDAQALLSLLLWTYLSEAGASLVDQKLNLNVVPKTRVVRLVAESFNYARLDRQKAKLKKRIKEHYPSAHFNRMSQPLKVNLLPCSLLILLMFSPCATSAFGRGHGPPIPKWEWPDRRYQFGQQRGGATHHEYQEYIPQIGE
ncbi:uncharacterized protein [Drosophila pseudoobscura]|uniref:Phosphatidylinositol 4-kinase type 2 n=1 Tax=Drosophila pseudoobscura pseudoobscura TaxID=46245 RepID=A0A6I8WDZ8_DROPS|nr:uncharacterized protein LOC117185594 [Drosophila pseudoobscura]